MLMQSCINIFVTVSEISIFMVSRKSYMTGLSEVLLYSRTLYEFAIVNKTKKKSFRVEQFVRSVFFQK